jgi:hypothetical protein
MNSVSFNIGSVEVKAETRAVKATWTRDMVKDLSSYHSLDVEKELAILLKEELRKQRISKRKKSINKIFQS